MSEEIEEENKMKKGDKVVVVNIYAERVGKIGVVIYNDLNDDLNPLLYGVRFPDNEEIAFRESDIALVHRENPNSAIGCQDEPHNPFIGVDAMKQNTTEITLPPQHR